jgi:hypothetical protein
MSEGAKAALADCVTERTDFLCGVVNPKHQFSSTYQGNSGSVLNRERSELTDCATPERNDCFVAFNETQLLLLRRLGQRFPH